jgi:hypothetical protein
VWGSASSIRVVPVRVWKLCRSNVSACISCRGQSRAAGSRQLAFSDGLALQTQGQVAPSTAAALCSARPTPGCHCCRAPETAAPRCRTCQTCRSAQGVSPTFSELEGGDRLYAGSSLAAAVEAGAAAVGTAAGAHQLLANRSLSLNSIGGSGRKSCRASGEGSDGRALAKLQDHTRPMLAQTDRALPCCTAARHSFPRSIVSIWRAWPLLQCVWSAELGGHC